MIGTADMRQAHEMCVKLLKAELEISVELGWEHEPKIFGIRLEYELGSSASRNI